MNCYPPLGFLQDERFPYMAFVYHQIFCDESGKYHNPNDPFIAFAGVSASADRLPAFDRHWRSLLLSYELDSLHMEKVTRLVEDHGYKFRKGQTVQERIELLYPFADCINKHLEAGFHQAWSIKGYSFLSEAAKKILGGSNDPYFLAFIRGLQAIVRHIGEDDRLSIIVDDDLTTAWDCYRHYRMAGNADWKIQQKAVAISFANDKHFPALQAADMLAFLTRHEAIERFAGVPNTWGALYDRLTTEPEPGYGIMRWFRIFADENQLIQFANEMHEVAEKRSNEKNKRVQQVRQHDGGTSKGSPQRAKEKTGRRKRGKT
jgi:hypothetical protein